MCHELPIPRRKSARSECRALFVGAANFLFLVLAVWCVGLILPSPAQAQGTANPQSLEWWNRNIVTFRATLAEATPQARSERALQQLKSIPDMEMEGKFHSEPFTYKEQSGVQFLLGDRPLFAIVEADMEADVPSMGLEAMATGVLGRLEAARTAWKESRSITILMTGAAKSLVIVSLGIASVGLLGRARRYLSGWLDQRRNFRAQRSSRMQWLELLDRLASKLLVIVQWACSLLIAYFVYEFVLSVFPLTAPIAQESRFWLREQSLWLGSGILKGLPDLVTIVIIIVVARALSDLVGYFFDAVRSGRFQIPFLHPETVTATRRIVIVVFWLITAAICYPYFPGSDTEAFRGLSVLAGLMLTVGASGIVTQGISGLVLIYSRALRPGDFVNVGGTEGVVTEVGTLAVKIQNFRNEEITVPNAVLLSSPIHNFTRLAATQGTLISTKVTIGYDAAWRVVHELLLSAAAVSGQFRSDPAPRVLQRSLSDFYVEYELILAIDDPMKRIEALSDLHEHIQDEFNRAGIQIMSPHFALQPRQPVMVPEADWHQQAKTANKSTVTSEPMR